MFRDLLGSFMRTILFYCFYFLLYMIVLCLCCLSGVIKNNNNNNNNNKLDGCTWVVLSQLFIILTVILAAITEHALPVGGLDSYGIRRRSGSSSAPRVRGSAQCRLSISCECH